MSCGADYQFLVLCMDKHDVHAVKKISFDAAWPIVLRALALHASSAEEMLSDGSSPEKSKSLLDIEPICICLRVLKTLVGTDYMMDLCPANICLEIIEMILSLSQQVDCPHLPLLGG